MPGTMENYRTDEDLVANPEQWHVKLLHRSKRQHNCSPGRDRQPFAVFYRLSLHGGGP